MWYSKIEGLEALALALFDCGAVEGKSQSPEGKGFRLKLHEKNPEAPLSPFNLNFRTPDNPKPGPLTPSIVSHAGLCLYNLAKHLDLQFDCVAGVPRAGDPFAEAFGQAAQNDGRDVPLLKLEKHESADHRKIGTIISGKYKPGNIVLPIDDLITKADSKFEAIDVFSCIGLGVNDLLVMADREQGGVDELRRRGYRTFALCSVNELLDLYVAHGRMTNDACKEIRKYLAAS